MDGNRDDNQNPPHDGDRGPSESDPGHPGQPSAVLAEILDHKRAEVDRAKAQRSFASLEADVAQAEPPRNFFRAVTRDGIGTKKAPADGGEQPPIRTAIIAEVKRQSPSAGLIRPEYAGEGFKPEAIATKYHAGGAAAISCLTDEHFFGGHLSFIDRIKSAVPLPVIRKDFIIDQWQLWESRAAGADAVLLIAEALTESEIVDMLILAQQLQLTVLLEVHSLDNLLRVRPHIGFPHPTYCLLGINNRDLATMTTDVSHTLRLVDLVDDPGVVVSESGITTTADLDRLREVGVSIVLVGEHFMRQAEPGEALRSMLES
ncbi:MAG: indole-3-glycerol phosphate synthase TrpC [Planctomycetota bacterium]